MPIKKTDERVGINKRGVINGEKFAYIGLIFDPLFAIIYP